MEQLTKQQADALLVWANDQNPGPWMGHSQTVANTAKTIADHSGMDGERAYVIGLLHDVGRYQGVSAMKHILDGYDLLVSKGDDMAAQICITHSFPVKNFDTYIGKNDCTPEESARIATILETATYTEYDRLIQLCDALALPTGICLMEKRLVDVVRRHGVNQHMLSNWSAIFTIFEAFQSKMGTSLYSLFPEVVNNTFA